MLGVVAPYKWSQNAFVGNSQNALSKAIAMANLIKTFSKLIYTAA
jgi:hypothetical protein